MTLSVRYLSTVRGWDDDLNQPPENEYVGFGERFQIDSEKERREALERSVARMQEYLGPFRLSDRRVVEPVPGRCVERYEVNDIDTGDLLVLWRIAVRPMSAASCRIVGT